MGHSVVIGAQDQAGNNTSALFGSLDIASVRIERDAVPRRFQPRRRILST